MVRSEARVGMKVQFGRKRDEKTMGEIVKLNGKTAKIRIAESRGSRSEAGRVWGVPYSMMNPVSGTFFKASTIPDVDRFDEVTYGKTALAELLDEAAEVIADELGVTNLVLKLKHAAKHN